MDYVALIKNNPVARTVKFADLKHNSDLTRLDGIDQKALQRVEKYKKSIGFIGRLIPTFPRCRTGSNC